MKSLRVLIPLWLVLLGCQRNDVSTLTALPTGGQPGELAAVITGVDLSLLADCACCAAYQLQVGTDTYEADQLPVSFNMLTPTVWIQFDRQQLSGTCSQVQNRIRITSIRSR